MNSTHLYLYRRIYIYIYGKKDLWSKLIVENKCLILRIFWNLKMFLRNHACTKE